MVGGDVDRAEDDAWMAIGAHVIARDDDLRPPRFFAFRGLPDRDDQSGQERFFA